VRPCQYGEEPDPSHCSRRERQGARVRLAQPLPETEQASAASVLLGVASGNAHFSAA